MIGAQPFPLFFFVRCLLLQQPATILHLIDSLLQLADTLLGFGQCEPFRRKPRLRSLECPKHPLPLLTGLFELLSDHAGLDRGAEVLLGRVP